MEIGQLRGEVTTIKRELVDERENNLMLCFSSIGNGNTVSKSANCSDYEDKSENGVLLSFYDSIVT